MLAQMLTIATLAAGLAGGGPSPPAGLGDAQLVGQRLIAGFEGERIPGSVRERIRGGRLGGVVLFPTNFDSRAEAERLVRELQGIPRPRGLRDPLLVMIDQEGGLVKRLPGPPRLSAEQMERPESTPAVARERRPDACCGGLGSTSISLRCSTSRARAASWTTRTAPSAPTPGSSPAAATPSRRRSRGAG